MKRTTRIALWVCLCLAACGEEARTPQALPEETASPTEQEAAGLVSASRLGATLPDRIASFEATADATGALVPTFGAPITRAERTYADGERRATLRVIDATRSPGLVVGFAAAQQLDIGNLPGEGELVATGIGERPGLASWDPATRTSEAQVLVQSRVVVALRIERAELPEDAVTALDGLDLAPFEALLR